MNLKRIIRGVVAGAIALETLAVAIISLRHLAGGFANSTAERIVSLLGPVCYFGAGYLAAGSHRVDRGSHEPGAGAVAGAGIALVGLVVAVVVHTVFFHGPLLSGDRAQHPVLVFVGPIVFGSAFGAIGGAWARRRSARPTQQTA